MSEVNGGAAFPQSGFERWAPEGGMTLRDYFAAKAMKEIDWKDKPLVESAADCYRVADAMLVARSA